MCGWQDDLVQLLWPTRRGGANKLSLVEAQKVVAEGNHLHPDHWPKLPDRKYPKPERPPPTDPRDPEWRPFDPAFDSAPTPDVRYWDLTVEAMHSDAEHSTQEAYYWLRRRKQGGPDDGET